MSYSKEFIKDKIFVHTEYYGWENAVAVVCARWKITNSQYPDGFAYHYFEKELDVNSITRETFVNIDDLTDADFEAFCAEGLTINSVCEIEMDALAEIRRSHWMATLNTYYENTE